VSDSAIRDQIRDFLLTRFPATRNVALDEDASLLEANVIDSLSILDIVAHLEEAFGITIQDDDLVPENFDNLGALERFVVSRRA